MNAVKVSQDAISLPSAPASATPPVHPVVIEPARGWSALRLSELWEYRDLLYFMTTRDLKARYRQTALGPLWIIIQPLFSMVIYTVIFGMIAKLPSGGVPYQVFTYCAILPWDLFGDTVNSGTTSLLASRDLISKIYFPRLLIPLSRVLSSLVDFGISFVILLGMLVFYRLTPNWGVLLLPVFLLTAIALGLGIGLWFSGIIVKYRDFGNVSGYMLRFLMYASPVIYSTEMVPPQLSLLYHLNPMANVLEGFRWALLGSPPPDWGLYSLSALLALALLVTGLFQFKRAERTIVDII